MGWGGRCECDSKSIPSTKELFSFCINMVSADSVGVGVRCVEIVFYQVIYLKRLY